MFIEKFRGASVTGPNMITRDKGLRVPVEYTMDFIRDIEARRSHGREASPSCIHFMARGDKEERRLQEDY